MRVLVELRAGARLPVDGDGERPLAMGDAGGGLSPGFVLDTGYRPVTIPRPIPSEPGASPFSLEVPRTFSTDEAEAPRVVRGSIPDDERRQRVLAEITANPDVVGVFSDPVIESCRVCPGDPAVGDADAVARELHVDELAAKGLDGANVTVAVVDSGINRAHLAAQGREPAFDAGRSWTPASVASAPGEHPVGHGTMCAYDVGIAAPRATLLDYALLLSRRPGETAMSGLLSDAVLAYSRLLSIASGLTQAGESLVVTNSWGMFSPDWDFPVGHPGNYSDNPAHPFNVIVASVEAAGADLLFAAGNCGLDCLDRRCRFGATRPICGANSHPAVLSVAGIDVNKERAGYSSQGPGRLSARKPDISAYTHFAGSQVRPVDGGTSAACPVMAGVIAAVRSQHPASKVAPEPLRSLVYKSAEDLGTTGFDYDHGWGAVDPLALAERLEGVRAAARPPTPAG